MKCNEYDVVQQMLASQKWLCTLKDCRLFMQQIYRKLVLICKTSSDAWGGNLGPEQGGGVTSWSF